MYDILIVKFNNATEKVDVWIWTSCIGLERGVGQIKYTQ